MVYSWSSIPDPTGGVYNAPTDTWIWDRNLVLVHPQYSWFCWEKYRFSLQLYTRMHGFKYEFSKIHTWGEAHQAPSPDPFLRSISGFALDSGFALGVLLDALSSPPSTCLLTPLVPLLLFWGWGWLWAWCWVQWMGLSVLRVGVHRGSVLESLEKAYPVFDNALDFSRDHGVSKSLPWCFLHHGSD